MLNDRDTDPRVTALLIERLRRLTPQERLLMADAASRELADLVIAGIRSEHPGIDDIALRREFARRTLPRDLFEKVFGAGARG